MGASEHRSQPDWTQAGLGLFLFLLVALTGCGALRFPGQTPGPLDSNPIEVLPTPTLAPLLLTPVPTNTPVPAFAPSSSPTPTFGLPLPEPTCMATPMWGLGDVWNNEAVRTRLGCPTGEQIGVQGEEIYFQNGRMLWRPDSGLIYVLFERLQPEGWGAFIDTFQPSDSEASPSVVEPTPVPGGPLYVQPPGRFGKLWRENAWLREKLGWAVIPNPKDQKSPVSHFNGALQDFERGVLFWDGVICFVLRTDDMSWDMY
ncbi:MAG: hypothetical protein ACPLRM_06560 [Anaerolineae bacterium]